MEYINDININEAVIHVLDGNGEEPILNEYSLDLDEDVYKFIYKHVEKCLKDDDIRYAKFNSERNIVKEVVQDYLNGLDNNLIELSRELARQLFIIMRGNCNIPNADLIITSIVTDQGPMIAILKMDYVNNFTHEIQFIDKKIGVGIVKQVAGLPGNSQKVQKAAFIKPIRENESYNLMVLDKQKNIKEYEYGANYFINNFLGATIVTNERDSTKIFYNACENWIRRSLTDDAARAEKIRTSIKIKLKEQDSLNIDEVSEELFKEEPTIKESFATDIKMKCVDENIEVDKTWIDKKLKRTRINVDKQIDLYIDEGTYNDPSKFQVVSNGDGSVNMIIKNVMNYIEK